MIAALSMRRRRTPVFVVLVVAAAATGISRCWTGASAAHGSRQLGVALRAGGAAKPQSVETQTPNVGIEKVEKGGALGKVRYKAADPKDVTRADTDPRLAALTEDNAYKEALEVFIMLQDKGLTDMFIKRLLEYYSSLTREQQLFEDPEVMGTLFRRDWSRVWPSQLNDYRAESFQKLTTFLRKPAVMALTNELSRDVIPDFDDRLIESEIKSQNEQFSSMEHQQRSDIFKQKMYESNIGQQFGKWTETRDEDYNKLLDKFPVDKYMAAGSQMGSYVFRSIQDTIVPLDPPVSFIFLSTLAALGIAYCVNILKIGVAAPEMGSSTPQYVDVQKNGLTKGFVAELKDLKNEKARPDLEGKSNIDLRDGTANFKGLVDENRRILDGQDIKNLPEIMGGNPR